PLPGSFGEIIQRVTLFSITAGKRYGRHGPAFCPAVHRWHGGEECAATAGRRADRGSHLPGWWHPDIDGDVCALVPTDGGMERLASARALFRKPRTVRITRRTGTPE